MKNPFKRKKACPDAERYKWLLQMVSDRRLGKLTLCVTFDNMHNKTFTELLDAARFAIPAVPSPAERAASISPLAEIAKRYEPPTYPSVEEVRHPTHTVPFCNRGPCPMGKIGDKHYRCARLGCGKEVQY